MCWAGKLCALKDVAGPAIGLVPPELYGPVVESSSAPAAGGSPLLKYPPAYLSSESPLDLQVLSWNNFLVFEKLQALWMIYGIMGSYKSFSTAKCNHVTVCITLCVSFAWPHLCQCWIAELWSNGCMESVAEIAPDSQAREGDFPRFSWFSKNYHCLYKQRHQNLN